MSNTLLADIEIAVLESIGQTCRELESEVCSAFPKLDKVKYRAFASFCVSDETVKVVRKFRSKHGLMLPFSIKGWKERVADAIEMNKEIEKSIMDAYEQEMINDFLRKE